MTPFEIESEDSPNPLEVAGISVSLAQIADDPQELIDLARRLLRTDAMREHGDRSAGGVASTGNRKRIDQVTTAIDDLGDLAPILRQICEEYQATNQPLKREIDKAYAKAAGLVKSAEWLSQHAVDWLGEWVATPSKHLINCVGKRLWLVDPVEKGMVLAAKAEQFHKERDSSIDRQIDSQYEALSNFPDESTRLRYEAQVRNQFPYDNDPNSALRWTTDQICKDHPDLEVKILEDDTFHVSDEMAAEYQAKYEKSEAKITYDKLITKVAQEQWAQANLIDASAIEMDIVFSSETQSLEESKDPNRNDDGPNTIARMRFAIEIDHEGKITTVKDGKRIALSGVTLIGTIEGRECKINSEFKDQVISGVRYHIFGGRDYDDDERGAIPRIDRFSNDDLAKKIVFDQLDFSERHFQSALSVSEDDSNIFYLVAAIEEGDEPLHFKILGEVWGVEPLETPVTPLVEEEKSSKKETSKASKTKPSVKKRSSKRKID